ncbi:lateral signaling target protein 2 homolog [Haliotis rufescens]|uniref:lateral signaling target protein 2 homolog n=1 Tax=Haliotis rufescens TaxID=6454 RepID=UPI00201F2FBA|nr:lateral signaling target protein 2 homolog [Haliotis rufescens]
MNSLRRWLYRPKRTDTSLLAQFFYSDEDLNMVAAELDSFDGRKDPERCTALVNQLRACQDKVLTAIQNIMEDAVPGQRASRDFRCKFPDDVIQENLAGQLWFGAECLAAGSSIMNREAESASMRPLARALTKMLDSLRTILREQCLKNIHEYTDRIKEALIIFDKLFAEFELSYVSAMVPVKTMKEYDTIQEITVLFSETVHRALKVGLLTQDMIDEYDPALMFTIPRLAIVSGLVVFREGPLNPDNDPWNMSDMFRPFQTLLFKIRELLYTLSPEEMVTLERALCSAEEPTFLASLQPTIESVEGFTQTEFMKLHADKNQDGQGGVSYEDTLGGPILVHTPNSGSPVTPVAQTEFPVGTMSASTSCATVIAASRGNSLDVEDQQEQECLLNKSESNDSGLHSENVSTSDSITTVSSTESQPLLNDTLTTTNSQGERTLAELARDETCPSLDDSASLEAMETGESSKPSVIADVSHSIRQMCADIVNDIVETTVVDSASLSVSPSVSSSVSPSLSPSGCSVSSNPMKRAEESSSDSVSMLSDSLSPKPNDESGSDSVSMLSDCVNQLEAACDLVAHDTDNVVGDSAIVTSSTSLESSPVHPGCSVIVDSSDRLDDTDQSHKLSKHGHSSRSKSTLQATGSRKSRKDKKSCKTSNNGSNHGNALDKLHSKVAAHSGEPGEGTPERLPVSSVQRLRYAESISSNCSSCRSGGSSVHGDGDWEKESCASSETSSYNSECHDDEEIALAIQAAELASRNEARSRFRSSSDMIHRLFVCISGVADQLQTNFASDLRNILRAVFDMNCAEPLINDDNIDVDVDDEAAASSSNESSPTRVRSHIENQEYLSNGHSSETQEHTHPTHDPPHWVPDEVSPLCMACRIPFTFVRRRHHCRNCGKIFCGRCSSNSVPLPHYGHAKPVRVCNRCFMFQVTPFTVAGAS